MLNLSIYEHVEIGEEKQWVILGALDAQRYVYAREGLRI
jgi:hypothetical protein